MSREKIIVIGLFFIILLFGYACYNYGVSKPPQIITKIQYIDDKCICIKCGKRFNFSEVQYLLEKIEENDK